MFCGAAMRRMRSSAASRSATTLLRPATIITLRGPNAHRGDAVAHFVEPVERSRFGHGVHAVTKEVPTSGLAGVFRAVPRRLRGVESVEQRHFVVAGQPFEDAVARIVIESPNDAQPRATSPRRRLSSCRKPRPYCRRPRRRNDARRSAAAQLPVFPYSLLPSHKGNLFSGFCKMPAPA